MKLTELIDPALMDSMLHEGMLYRREHPDDPSLVVYNYTQRAQFDRVWNDATLNCRGLVVHGDKVIARPWRKFFNYDEVSVKSNGPFVAYEKIDGSLGIAYTAPDGMPAIATRGSFNSDQAVHATDWARNNGAVTEWLTNILGKGLTPLFEIIYPENRIVVDYGNFDGLVLLGIVDIETGEDVLDTLDWPGESVASYPGMGLEDLMSLPSSNREGYVLRYDNGVRLKVKFDEYIRLHKVLTKINEVTIWEFLRDRMSIQAMAQYVPDEFFKWMQATAYDIQKKFTEVESSCFRTLAKVNRQSSRKEQAEFILSQPHPGIVFRMLDDKPYTSEIWKLVRPTVNEQD